VKLGFIGLGNIGLQIASDLVASQHQVVVHDIVPAGPAELKQRGATVASCPAEVARDADIIGICVRNDADVHEVFEAPTGILSAARPGLLAAIHSTVRIATVHDVADKAKIKGVRVVDAPVSRGVNSPASKGIVFMIGGASSDLEKMQPYLELVALKVVKAGALGAGMALKICNNLLTYLTMVSANDAIRLAEAAGLNVKLLAEVTSSNGVAGPTLSHILTRRSGEPIRSQIVTPPVEAIVGLGEKDLDCALEVSRDLGLELPAVALARAVFRQTVVALQRK
jgi:3-hydroxyisobutyrate dehydrogenase-like beta-hydroxyacid dehydrogenase